MPEKATKLKGLGKAGYRLVDARPAGEHGPTVEIGWLSEAEQLQTLSFTFAEGRASRRGRPTVDAKLLDLAKAMDTTDG